MSKLEVENLIDEYGNIIYKFCLKLTKNKEDAEELYQQTFLKTLELKEGILYEKNPKSYLISISINLWKNERRKRLRRKIITNEINIEENNLDVVDNKESVEEGVVKRETIKLVNDAINLLKDKIRIPMIMYYTLELSIDEISCVLKIPKGTVKSRLFKGRENVRKILEEGNYER